MCAIGERYRHVITNELVQIYYIYRHAATKQITLFDLISAITHRDSDVYELEEELRHRAKRGSGSIRAWTISRDKFERYFDRA